MQAEDWLEDMLEFDLNDVADACAEWRRSSSRRPLIADIRPRCVEAQRRHAEQTPAWDREAYAREAGFDSWAQRQAAIERQQDSWAKAEAWRRSQATEAAE